MRADIDRLMAERELDWLVAYGAPGDSAEVHYLVRGARVGHCYVLKGRGQEPFLVVGSMERDEARQSGLPFATFLDYGHAEVAKLGLRPIEQSRRVLANVLEKHGVRGRTAFIGAGSLGSAPPLIQGALALRPEVVLAEDADKPTILAARETKDADEVARMRDVARRTEEVVADTVAFLRGCKAGNGVLLRAGGAPLKIGDVKDRIALDLARRRLDDHGQTIFAAGREAGFPHSRGTETEPVPLGKPIIFDIFPQEKGGGYYFDFTRTFWIGPASERCRAVYAAVQAAFDRSLAAVKIGAKTRDADAAVCDAFEERGFVTKRQQPKTEIGYCHSVGHGVGLDIHERPHMTIREGYEGELFRAGNVFTIEPGLYYPDDEIGVRLEDTLYLRPDGSVENLATFPKEPEIALS